MHVMPHPCDGVEQHLDLPDLDELQHPHRGQKVFPGLLARGVLQQTLRVVIHLTEERMLSSVFR